MKTKWRRTWEHLEVRSSELLALIVAPEPNRKRRMRSNTDELAWLSLVLDVVPFVVEYLNLHAEAFALQFYVILVSGKPKVDWRATNLQREPEDTQRQIRLESHEHHHKGFSRDTYIQSRYRSHPIRISDEYSVQTLVVPIQTWVESALHQSRKCCAKTRMGQVPLKFK